jgi:LysR family hydrogen peroxide-inducible transcriptional activator
MAVPVETRSASVAIARFNEPKPKRMIGMIWRKSSSMVEQLEEISKIVKRSAESLDS